VNGPIVPDSSKSHACYASRVFWGVFASPINDLDSPHCFRDQCPTSLPVSVPSTPVSLTSTLPSPARSFSALPYTDFVRGHSSSPYTASALPTSLPVDSRPAAHFRGLLNLKHFGRPSATLPTISLFVFVVILITPSVIIFPIIPLYILIIISLSDFSIYN
jgi:hypothetical protein